MKFKNIFGGILIIYALLHVDASTIKKRSLAENIHSGIQFAGKIFGIDAASDVADLVARTFSQNLNYPPKRDQDRQDQSTPFAENQSPGNSLISNLLRIIGLDGGKIGALAVNGIIFLAQMIGRSLISSLAAQWQQPLRTHTELNGHDPLHQNDDHKTYQQLNDHRRNIIEGAPLDWILDNESSPFQKLLTEVRDKNLPQRIEEMVSEMENQNGEADCIKMLVCKCAPFVWGMQRAIDDRLDSVNDNNNDQENEIDNNENRLDSFFKYLPNMKEFAENGKTCESKYEHCNN